MGINCYPLDKDKDYTLCIEILNSDYQLWLKSVATIDKTTSQGFTMLVSWYKSFLIDTQIIMEMLNKCIISK